MPTGHVITGTSMSFTMTLKLQLAVFPAASVAVQVTVFVPVPKLEPLVGTQATVTPGQLSVAVAAKFTTGPHWPGTVLVVMFAGQVRMGISMSSTVTLKLQVAVLPEASVAAQITRFVPVLKVEPLTRTQATTTPGQLSLALAAKVTTALH